MLSIAKAMWDQTSVYQLTNSEVERGFSVVQNTNVPASCNGSACLVCSPISLIFDFEPVTTAGAVFAVSLCQIIGKRMLSTHGSVNQYPASGPLPAFDAQHTDVDGETVW